jgi:8-oxo-dGTP pyrophosphatase MutT (NUDIX family)
VNWDAEYHLLADKYGFGQAELRNVAIDYTDSGAFRRYVTGRPDRHGEVVFGVERPNGRVIVTRARDYGPGIYRLPSGGIEPDEAPLGALLREVREELGLKTVIKAFYGLVLFELKCDDERRLFPSFVFHVRETGGRLLADATEREIAGCLAVDCPGLSGLAERLAALPGSIAAWGRNRAATTGFFAEHWQKQL